MLANQFAHRDGLLRVHMIGHGAETPKSDAFLLEYNGVYIMIDGGKNDCDATLEYLMSLRRALLSGRETLWNDPSCRLKLSVIVSHCHKDHVGALYRSVFPSPFVELDTLYMPPACGLDSSYGRHGDDKYRPHLKKALASAQPQAKVVDLMFGAENRIVLPMCRDDDLTPVITICPPWINSASPERIALLLERSGNEDGSEISMATAVMNNNSSWVHVRHGERTFLFTGDTVKKTLPMGYEMVDEMIDQYRDVLGEQVDVLKYVHHGYKRDGAAAVMMSLSPRYVVLTTPLATAGEAIRERFPDNPVRIVNCGTETYVFTCDGENLTVKPEI